MSHYCLGELKNFLNTLGRFSGAMKIFSFFCHEMCFLPLTREKLAGIVCYHKKTFGRLDSRILEAEYANHQTLKQLTEQSAIMFNSHTHPIPVNKRLK